MARSVSAKNVVSFSYTHGFVRVAACVPISRVADPRTNAAAIIDIANVCNDRAVAVAVFPELCLSGYAIEDLLNQQSLLTAIERGLRAIVDAFSNG
jgi:NAD+ synthase (glutamine-hydrolysing)